MVFPTTTLLLQILCAGYVPTTQFYVYSCMSDLYSIPCLNYHYNLPNWLPKCPKQAQNQRPSLIDATIHLDIALGHNCQLRLYLTRLQPTCFSVPIAKIQTRLEIAILTKGHVISWPLISTSSATPLLYFSSSFSSFRFLYIRLPIERVSLYRQCVIAPILPEP
jgi:hypothetical protein